MSVDALGNPLRLLLTARQRHESTQAEALLADHQAESVLADTAYDAQAILDLIVGLEAEPVIPPRRNRKEQRAYDKELYKMALLHFSGQSAVYHLPREPASSSRTPAG